ncbi:MULTISPECIES: hypothetical protein [unclassified Pseudonocardia]|nr:MULTISPECIES: hypothetical protein [unclassified Pseudonocardia]
MSQDPVQGRVHGSVPVWRVAVHGGPIDDTGATALAEIVTRGMTAPR